ncbi:MAG: TonB-dependent receptor [Deltaproteobacteria bacterium RIFOXYD12_FULL_56_24]|nr:MAG: TonB-dependent receptor [Deltaproteobacteria bacterium RIFOXYD12_FULL_56_24]
MKKNHKRKYRTSAVFVFSALVLASPALAAEKPEDLGTMSVTDAPIIDPQPLNTNFIELKTVRSFRPATSDTASLLRGTPGVSLYSAGGVSSLPAIHGMADDRLRIKVDGMDLISACANHMNSPLSYIDPTNVDNIQVFAGITPVSAGGDSIGGTILVNSAPPEFARIGSGEIIMKGETGAFYRSNSNAHGAHLVSTVAGESLSLSYSGAIAQAGNYNAAKDFKAAGLAAAGRGWLDGDEVGSSMYKAINHDIGLALRYEKHLVEMKVGIQDIPYQGYPNQRMDMTGNDSTQLNLRYKGDYQWGALNGRAYNEKTRHAMQFYDDKLYWYMNGVPGPISGGSGGKAAGMPMDTEGNNTGVTAKADFFLSKRDTLSLGGEIQRYRLDDWWDPSGRGMWPNTFWNINDGQRDRFDLFSEWEAAWNPQWLTLFGVRNNNVRMDTGPVQGYNTTSALYLAESTAFNASDREQTDHNFDLTALIRLTPDSNQTYEVGYARKTRSPNLYERYAWSTGGMAMRMVNFAGDGNGYVGNLNLEPETAHTVSATFDLHDAFQKKWSIKLTPYYSYIEDYVDAERLAPSANIAANNQTVTNAFVYLRFINQSARTYGADLSAQLTLAEHNDYGKFTLSGLLNYVRGDNRTTGDNLYNIMPLNGKVALLHSLGNLSNTIELELVDEKDRVSQTRNELTTGGYALLNLRSSYNWKHARLDLGIENLLDQFYDHPLAGAYLGQGATMSATGVAWGTPVPGMGRSIYTALSFKF